jgi:predicted metal-dependent phosphoesterase TrpH
MSRGPAAGRADLHLHSTASDGVYTPAQVVDLARRCGLAAIALTDHDTFAGLDEARLAAGPGVEVISGSEVTCAHQGQELHILCYFAHPDHPSLSRALDEAQRARRGRFEEMVRRLRQAGVSVLEKEGARPASLGRRYLAGLLVQQGHASTLREVFSRWLGPGGKAFVPREGLPVGRVLACAREAGGVASWAHPAYDDRTFATLRELAGLGLSAVEVYHPDLTASRSRHLAEMAGKLGLAVSGGSDCHGPGPRAVGSVTVSNEQLEALRLLARGEGCSERSTRR